MLLTDFLNCSYLKKKTHVNEGPIENVAFGGIYYSMQPNVLSKHLKQHTAMLLMFLYMFWVVNGEKQINTNHEVINNSTNANITMRLNIPFINRNILHSVGHTTDVTDRQWAITWSSRTSVWLIARCRGCVANGSGQFDITSSPTDPTSGYCSDRTRCTTLWVSTGCTSSGETTVSIRGRGLAAVIYLNNHTWYMHVI